MGRIPDHGELLMLGFEVAQSTVSKYMVRRRNPPSQPWNNFCETKLRPMSAIDMCVVPRSPLISCLHSWFWVTAGDSCCGSR